MPKTKQKCYRNNKQVYYVLILVKGRLYIYNVYYCQCKKMSQMPQKFGKIK